MNLSGGGEEGFLIYFAKNPLGLKNPLELMNVKALIYNAQ